MINYLIIKADTNDGDYIYSVNAIDDESLKKIKPVIYAIKNNKNDYLVANFRNLRNNEKSAEQRYSNIAGFDEFNELVPFLDNNDVHTINSIEVLQTINRVKLI